MNIHEVVENLADDIINAVNNYGEQRITTDRAVIQQAVHELVEELSESPTLSKMIARILADYPDGRDAFEDYFASAAEKLGVKLNKQPQKAHIVLEIVDSPEGGNQISITYSPDVFNGNDLQPTPAMLAARYLIGAFEGYGSGHECDNDNIHAELESA